MQTKKGSEQTAPANILATAAQLYADSLAVKLIKHPDIIKAGEEVYKQLEAGPVNKKPEGLAATKQAAYKPAFLSLQFAIANNPAINL